MIDIKDVHTKMMSDSLNFGYRGKVNFELIDSFLNLIYGRLEVIEENLNTRKRVFSIFMECLQNLCFHIEPIDGCIGYDPMCVALEISNGPDAYIITTGNFISVNRVRHLKDWLDLINKSSKDELKALYNNVLTNNKYSKKGGGGLGFLDIARKSNNNIDYIIEPVDNKNYFFSLKVSIKKTKA